MTEFRHYLSQEKGRVAALARATGLAPAFLSQMAHGRRPVPQDKAPHIERATAAAITVEQLRPDVRWHRVPDPAWPHADGRPCIDVAAPAAVQLADTPA